MQAQKKRDSTSYLYFHSFLSTLFPFFFFCKFNFQYHTAKYNSWLLGAWLLVPIAILVDKKLKSHWIASFISYCGASLILTILLFVSGGLDAPGIFWVGLMPIVAGVLLGNKGQWVGVANLILVFIFFWTTDFLHVTPNLIAELHLYEEERRINTALFLLFTIALTRQFLIVERRSKQALAEQHKNVENLLRVLIHDVATPLTIIDHMSSRIKAANPDEKVMTLAEGIRKQAHSLTQILKSIREFRAISDGKKKLNKHTFELGRLLDESIEAMSPKAVEKRISINVHPSPLTQLQIETDEILFKTVIFGNILSNAIKFTPNGGVIEVQILQPSVNFVEIQVRDHGIGIPTDILKAIFDINISTSRPGTAGEIGTGYGMHLVKQYLETLGGKIVITSSTEDGPKKELGTCVRIQHPILHAKLNHQ